MWRWMKYILKFNKIKYIGTMQHHGTTPPEKLREGTQKKNKKQQIKIKNKKNIP